MAEQNLPAETPEEGQSLASIMTAQHPLHGMVARVFEELGGEDFLLDWAEEHETEFIKLMFKLAPAAIPKGQSGGIHLHVHQDLQPGALDQAQGVTIDHTPD